MPPIVVTGRDDKVTSRQKQHAEEKLQKLERFFDGIIKIEAILSHGSSHGAGEAQVELLISVSGGKPLVCHSRSKELYAAVDIALDKAEKQLTRYKGKLRSRKGGTSLSTPEVASMDVEGEAGEEEDYQDIVEKRDFS